MTEGQAESPLEGHQVLEVEHMTAGYGDTVVLRDVSLRVADGSVVALLGPNGAGKTTLLRTAAGFIRPTRGTIRFDGEDVTGAAAHVMARKGLCLLPEGRGIFPSLSVRDNLLLQSPKGEERASIERAVDLFPILGTRIGQTAGSLSGGEQQMLALVRAAVSTRSWWSWTKPPWVWRPSSWTRSSTRCARSWPRARRCCWSSST